MVKVLIYILALKKNMKDIEKTIWKMVKENIFFVMVISMKVIALLILIKKKNLIIGSWKDDF